MTLIPAAQTAGLAIESRQARDSLDFPSCIRDTFQSERKTRGHCQSTGEVGTAGEMDTAE